MVLQLASAGCGLALAVNSATAQSVIRRTFQTDTTPGPFAGGVCLGLEFGASRNEVPQLRLVLMTEQEYAILGFEIDSRVARSGGRIDLQILGVHGPWLGPAAMGPAIGSRVLHTAVGGAPDTLYIRYGSDTDRYLTSRTPTHAYIHAIEASFTSIGADSLEAANPGTVRVRCEPAGDPVSVCEDLVAGLLSIGMRSDTLTPYPETLRTRAFGSTLYEAIPEIRQRWLIAHGLIEKDISHILNVAKAFTAQRGGNVTVDTWDGRSIQCRQGRCGPRR
jgi:hypothetical protein